MKFEKNIKEKFDNRTIQPSPGAWERVADQLREEGEKKKTRIWPKIAIAAGFIGILILSAPFLFPTEKSLVTPLVDVPHDTKSGADKITIASEENEKMTQDIDIISTEAEKQTKRTQKRPKQLKNEWVVNEDFSSQKEQIGMQDSIASQKPTEHMNNLAPAVEQSVAIEVSRLLAAVQTAEQEGSQVSDYTIDSLLAQAREKIVKDRIYEEQTENLSATALLESVENELDQSFRERVFDALRDGFMKAREAIVSRNQ